MRQEETRGKVKQVTGRAKEAAGILTGNKKLENEGSLERAEGAVQEGIARAGRKIGEAVDDIAKAIKK